MAKIVVVDDSKLMRNLLKRVLEEAGHEVETWDEVTAAEIPAMVLAAHPSLIITDYQMPGCNGLTLARMARKANPSLPIILLTATHDPAVEDGAKRQDVNRILYKPLHEDQLLEAVSQLV